MSAGLKADRNVMKQANQRLVMRLIQSRGPISRKDIAHISGLSPASVSGLTGELIESGLVHEVGEAEGEGRAGRRAVLLRVNPHAAYVVGVKVAVSGITCVLTDLDANVLFTIETPSPTPAQAEQLSGSRNPQQLIQATIATIERLLAQAQIDATRLVGIGVCINGIVDAELGISRFAPHFNWRDVALAAPLVAHFGIPMYLENDARALTIAEQWFGAGRGVDCFVTVVSGYGVGAGVVTNGQVYRGSQSGAGEFGHMVLQFDGPLCSCGKHGCLESLAGIPAIMRQLQTALDAGTASSLATQPLTLEAIVAAVEAGDPLARQAVADAGRWLGTGLAHLVNILDPHLLIMTGELLCFGRWYFEPMEAALRAYAFNGLAESLQIVIEPSNNAIWARGAACVVLGQLFSATASQARREDAVLLPATMLLG